MSILTAEAVSVVRKYCTLPGMKENIESLADSHEELRALYDALLAGATAQRIATLMDEADKARVEIERLKAEVKEGIDAHYDMHAVNCNNCGAEILARISGKGVECLSGGEESGDLGLCGACMGAEFYTLDAAFGIKCARIAELETTDSARQDACYASGVRDTEERLGDRIAELEKERNAALTLSDSLASIVHVEAHKKVGPHVGSHSPRNVWDGDRQIAYASDEEQAARIVAALKSVERSPIGAGWCPVCEDIKPAGEMHSCAPRVPGSLAGEGL